MHDEIVVKENGVKKRERKYLLMFRVFEVYGMFCEENTNVKISLTSFQRLRPKNVLTADHIGMHSMCCCIGNIKSRNQFNYYFVKLL